MARESHGNDVISQYWVDVAQYSEQMATNKDFVTKVLTALHPLDVVVKPMFGEYGLYFKGKMFGLLCDNSLFVKETAAGSALARRVAKAPPYPNAKLAFKISAAKMKEREWLTALVEATTAELPTPKERTRRTVR